MSKVKWISGQKFGRLTAIDISHIDEKHKAVWNCICECGKEHKVTGAALRNGSIKSCGCLQRENAQRVGRKYGPKTGRKNLFQYMREHRREK